VRHFHWLLCVSLLLASSHAVAGEDSLAAIKSSLGSPQGKIVNGVIEPNYPSVGALLFGNNPETATAWCSGTMIGCQTFLTAGHCVDGETASDFLVFLPSAGFFTVASITPHPSYSYPQRDVAVITLGSPVNGIAPTPINTSANPPPNSPGIIVGFGRDGGNDYDYGLKRSGAVDTQACPSDSFYSGSVCWKYTAPLGPPGSNSDTCNGDSGGPLLIDFGSGNTVAGITSGGTSANCDPGDLSYDGNVFLYSSFIQSVGGADLSNTACGTLPQVGGPMTQVMSASGELSSATPDALSSFQVPAGTAVLRVAMTGSEDYGSNFNLYVKHGSAPTTSVYDCHDAGPNQYSYCQVIAPASGTWYTLAHRAAGLGEYQITVTIFARDCSQPASDGLACDDGNPCTTGDVCAAGACSGTPADGIPCDDGESCTSPDVCVGGVCTGTPVPDGTPCDDGNPCSSPDLCEAGTCSGAAPAASCRGPFVPDRSLIQIRDRTPDNGDRLTWKWRRGSSTSIMDFGDPIGSTDYWLCAYDQTAGISHRILEERIPAGSNWVSVPSGYNYHDPDQSEGGVSSVHLKQGGDGQASIIVRGRGGSLALPPLGLHQDTTVTVQLLNGTTCWESLYDTNIRNDPTQFKARD